MTNFVFVTASFYFSDRAIFTAKKNIYFLFLRYMKSGIIFYSCNRFGKLRLVKSKLLIIIIDVKLFLELYNYYYYCQMDEKCNT